MSNNALSKGTVVNGLLGLEFLLLVTFLWVPTLIVILVSFGESSSTTLPVTDFSLRWFHVLFNDSAMMRAIKNSILVSGMSAVLSTLIGLITSLALRRRFRGWNALNFISITPLMISRLVLGVSLLIFLSAVGFPLGFWSVAVSLGTLSAAYSTLIISASLSEFDQSLEEAAYDLGASRSVTLRKITLPLISPAIISSLLLSFTVAFDELIIPLFVQGYQFQVLPVEVFSRLRFKITPEINAVATIATTAVVITVVAIAVVQSRMKHLQT